MNPKTASEKPAQGVDFTKGNGALTAEKGKNGNSVGKAELIIMPKRKMTVTEKLDSLHKLEALASKVEYLRDRKVDVEKFGQGTNGFQGAKLILEAPGCEDVNVSNPAIVEELLGIAKNRLKEFLIKAEKEVEEFEII